MIKPPIKIKTIKTFHSRIIPINGRISALKKLVNMLIVLRTVALFSDSTCLFIPLIYIRYLGYPVATIERINKIPNIALKLNPKKIYAIPQIISTEIKSFNLFLILCEIMGITFIKIKFTTFIAEATKPKNNIGTLTAPRYI